VCLQTNHEGCFIEYLHKHRRADALLVNPGAWTHYSYAIRDALELVHCPVAEVHLSDITAREEWRRHSVISSVATFTVAGKGPQGYIDAVRRLVEIAGR
jgi:3-dehydroquinate dehydratase-2